MMVWMPPMTTGAVTSTAFSTTGRRSAALRRTPAAELESVRAQDKSKSCCAGAATGAAAGAVATATAPASAAQAGRTKRGRPAEAVRSIDGCGATDAATTTAIAPSAAASARRPERDAEPSAARPSAGPPSLARLGVGNGALPAACPDSTACSLEPCNVLPVLDSSSKHPAPGPQNSSVPASTESAAGMRRTIADGRGTAEQH
mmetsp:Transcript_88937/g.287616  ORF Transcript_88937/g.287616 Transcript_88937/m.287616 type:complete len:203 (-) Transcript_88937:47-655(-)